MSRKPTTSRFQFFVAWAFIGLAMHLACRSETAWQAGDILYDCALTIGGSVTLAIGLYNLVLCARNTGGAK